MKLFKRKLIMLLVIIIILITVFFANSYNLYRKNYYKLLLYDITSLHSSAGELTSKTDKAIYNGYIISEDLLNTTNALIDLNRYCSKINIDTEEFIFPHHIQYDHFIPNEHLNPLCILNKKSYVPLSEKIILSEEDIARLIDLRKISFEIYTITSKYLPNNTDEPINLKEIKSLINELNEISTSKI